MKERGILFSAPMVKALLAGTKTQTRRIVKDPPRHWSEWRDIDGVWHPTDYTQIGSSSDGLFIQTMLTDGEKPERPKPSPYGVKGDRLWVRETWGIAGHSKRDPGYVVYRADCEGDYDEVGNPVGRWHPSIFMKRDDSRITLEITAVRAERLQYINEEDAKAEGVGLYVSGHGFVSEGELHADPGYANYDCRRQGFAQLWDAINGDRAPWSSNPWVWVVSFSRLAKP